MPIVLDFEARGIGRLFARLAAPIDEERFPRTCGG
jgi:hypothetical protein